jgi:protein-disulfide isomerase
MLIFRGVLAPPDVDCFIRMASRKAQKEAARERRLAEERARHERERRTRRLRMVGGVVVGAIALVAVAIAVSSSGNSAASVVKPSSPAAKKAQATVNSLLQGIPQQGNTLGSPSAKVTVTEYGDLECPVCKSFALGAENQLIANEVRSGKVKLVYRSLETASGQANGSMFVPQQAAALAAGQQKLGWNYIELFYHEQGDETTSYVNDNFLSGLAKQVSGLNVGQWASDRQSSSLSTQVNKDMQAAAAAGYSSTPTLLVAGPKSQAKPIVGSTDYASLQSAIKSVSAG